MASCVRKIHTKNYQNLLTGFQVTIKNVGDVFLGQCKLLSALVLLPINLPLQFLQFKKTRLLSSKVKQRKSIHFYQLDY